MIKPNRVELNENVLFIEGNAYRRSVHFFCFDYFLLTSLLFSTADRARFSVRHPYFHDLSVQTSASSSKHFAGESNVRFMTVPRTGSVAAISCPWVGVMSFEWKLYAFFDSFDTRVELVDDVIRMTEEVSSRRRNIWVTFLCLKHENDQTICM